MANATPDPPDLEPQDDFAEVFDETHYSDEAEFSTLDEMPDVYDATQARGDARDDEALDAADYDPEDLDDETLEDDEDVDDRLRDELEDQADDDERDEEEDLDAEDGVDELEWDEAEVMAVADVDPVTDADDEEADEYEAEDLSDEDLRELGYQGADGGAGEAAAAARGSGARAEDVPEQTDPRQEALLDEGVEETFPASDPVSVKRIT
jgi:hypothetical protein